MKKILVLCLLLLLSSCSSNTGNEIFKKKQECLKYKENIEKKLQNEVSGVSKLDLIFYSPKKDSCLYSYYYSGHNGNNYAYIMDYLTNEIIEIGSIANTEDEKDFENKIKELKGE